MRLSESGASGLTLVDVSRDALEATRSLALAANPSCRVVAVVADVANAPALEAAFATHARAHGGLHLCFNNAGVGERSDWRSVVDVNLNAVVHGTRLATALMARGGGGAVVNVASAGGVFAMPQAPVYSATKAAVVLFSKSLAHLAETKRVRVNALCPQFTDTALVGAQFDALGKEKAEALLAQTGGSLLRVDQVVDAAMELVRDDARAGEALAVMNARGGVAAYVPVPDPRRWRAIDVGTPLVRNPPRSGPSSRRPPPAFPAPAPVPATHRAVSVARLSADFRRATEVVTRAVPEPGPGQVLVERRWTGVNASDVNFTAGRYFGGAKKAAKMLPFDAGFESVGVVVRVGPPLEPPELSGERGRRSENPPPPLAVGQPVATTTFGGFSEYAVVESKLATPVPAATPEALALLTSGLTASIALEQAGGVDLPMIAAEEGRGRTGGEREESGRRVRKKTVLVTAAAGGTGQLAAQLAKLAGHRVVATCGGARKARMLASLGVDRVVDYRAESLREVLRREFPTGIDLAYESVGGDFFAAAVDALAPKGRVIVIGMMSQYTSGGPDAKEAWTPSEHRGLPEKLLWKSGAIVGFFLPQYASEFKRHLAGLFALLEKGELKVEIDPARFVGVDACADAVAHLQGGQSIGKVVVDIAGGRRGGAAGAGAAVSKL